MVEFNNSYTIPERVIPWICSAVGPYFDIDFKETKDPRAKNAPWRRCNGDVKFIITAYDNTMSVKAGDDGNVDDFHTFLLHLLRRIGDSFLVFETTWICDTGTRGVCATSLFKEKWALVTRGDTTTLAQYATDLRNMAIK